MANVSAFFGDLQDWIAASDVVEHALKAGDPAPAFLAPSADGGLVSSEALLRDGPLVISFFRGSWCSFCVDELHALNAALPQFRGRSSQVVAISPETAEPVRRLQADLSIRVLSDVDYGIGLLFGVIFVVPPFMRAHLEAHGVDLAGLHGSSIWMLPIPATYVVAPDGRIAAAFVDADFTCRADPRDVLEALDRLQA